MVVVYWKVVPFTRLLLAVLRYTWSISDPLWMTGCHLAYWLPKMLLVAFLNPLLWYLRQVRRFPWKWSLFILLFGILCCIIQCFIFSALTALKGLYLVQPAYSGFDLPRCSWSLLNRFRTGQGPCKSLSIQVGADTVAELLMWWASDHEPHCGLLPANQVRRWTDDSTYG